jgi:hypothetical protein
MPKSVSLVVVVVRNRIFSQIRTLMDSNSYESESGLNRIHSNPSRYKSNPPESKSIQLKSSRIQTDSSPNPLEPEYLDLVHPYSGGLQPAPVVRLEIDTKGAPGGQKMVASCVESKWLHEEH